ncbi:prepilin peptidase [Acrocarpospora catenulata]|uniref:prepilin peptidase n=1 Tax=Acrocarpospora catenulata TaxID=2836182 RepID=UPI001BD94A00|nr:A24 family peptidase [Acrocarpospora catenulata]
MFWIGLGGLVLAGGVAGSYARALAAGFGEETQDARQEAVLAFRTAAPVPRRPYLAELVTGVVFGLVGWRFWGSPLLPALLYGVAAGAVLTLVDWRTFRLPDVVTLPSYLVVAGLLAPTGQLPMGLACGLATGGVYLLLWLASPAGVGLGDVKLGVLLGLLSGAVGVNTAVLAGVGGQLLGALYALGLLATKRATRRTAFPFGPFMITGALLAVLIWK